MPGGLLDRRRLTRRQSERFVDTLAAGTTVVMEACGTAHDWGRRCQARGPAVRLLPVQYVRPYVRRNKTDRTDTEGMLEAHRCAGIRPVPVKTCEQQALQALHRVRTQWQATRTNRVNVLHGLLPFHQQKPVRRPHSVSPPPPTSPLSWARRQPSTAAGARLLDAMPAGGQGLALES